MINELHIHTDFSELFFIFDCELILCVKKNIDHSICEEIFTLISRASELKELLNI